MPSHWLVKQEPSGYPFAQLVEDGRTTWDGVRNAQARNSLQAMAVGDRVLYYHSGDEKAVVGIARVVRAAHPDPTADDPAWVAVDLAPVEALPRKVTLAQAKADPAFEGSPLVKQSRLSVIPLTPGQYRRLLALGGAKA